MKTDLRVSEESVSQEDKLRGEESRLTRVLLNMQTDLAKHSHKWNYCYIQGFLMRYKNISAQLKAVKDQLPIQV